MRGSLALVLHAHLPFVRHPEHRQSLEELWLFEAITECYLPLLRILDAWDADSLNGRITLSLTPTLGAMLRDPLLQDRFRAHLERLIRLAEAEAHRTLFEKELQSVALFYLDRLQTISRFYDYIQRDVVGAFARLQQAGRVELIASAATHAVLPLLRTHPPSLRAQIRAGCDAHAEMFGVRPQGFWLPECAWAGGMDDFLAGAGIRWFIVESHGLLHATPRPRYGLFAPVLTKAGLAAFGRDSASARQVWSRDEGYPGDPWYREFYRDAGFDLDLDYLRDFLPIHGRRGFTGIKYHRITGGTGPKQVYDRRKALERAAEHARHFLECRSAQLDRLESLMDHAVVVCPYDAELFGHWWFEGPEFLDQFVRKAHAADVALVSPGDYLRTWPAHQAATPADSSWGEQGFWRVWLNEQNHWITGRLGFAQEHMSRLATRQLPPGSPADRALRQAARELLLAQASDWPFIIRTGTSPGYASRRVKTHLLRFWKLCNQIHAGHINESFLKQTEDLDNFLPNLHCSHWR